MSRFSDTVRDEIGRAIPGVQVYVYEWDWPTSATGNLSALYDDDLVTPLANPLTSDEFGEFYFNTSDGIKLLEYHYGGKLLYRSQIISAPIGSEPLGLIPGMPGRAGKFLAFDASGVAIASSGTGADAGLRTDLAASTGSSLIGTPIGGTIQSRLFGSNLGAQSSGVISDLSTTTTFTAADSGSGVYKINNQINCNGATNVGSVRSFYSGSNLLTTAGTCSLLSGAHFFVWNMGQGNVTTMKGLEVHAVAGIDSNSVDVVSPGTITTLYFINTAGITLGANAVLPLVFGLNIGQLTENAKVVKAYGVNVEHNQSTAVGGEFIGFRSQVRNGTGSWSIVSNTNDGSVAAPAGFSGAVAIGANANGATPVVPTWTLTVTSLNSDYAAGVINRHATNPFGLRIQFANVSPADSGHDFIHCDANGTTYFQVASSGILSIAGTQVLGPRRTGWGADTGTAKRTANATYSATAEATYTQATIQALMNAVRDLSQTQKAIKDDLISHGIIGP